MKIRSLLIALAMVALPVISFSAEPAPVECKDCGTVVEVKEIKQDASNDPATATAVAAGSNYQVVVKMDNGKSRKFSFKQAPDYKAGDKVKVVNGSKLTKQ